MKNNFDRFCRYPVCGRLCQYALLIRAHQPVGFYLLLWPCLWALWIAAEGPPDWQILLVFVSGTLLMRSAGCAINDFFDRHIDARVERTRDRPLAIGSIAPCEAVIVFLVLSALAFALVLTLDTRTILMSFVAFALAITYPLVKRVTYLPQIFLGAAFAWAIPMAFVAVTGSTTKVTWLLYIVAVLWAVGYDTIYAMADRQDDRRIGVKSTAVLLGEADTTIVTAIEVIAFIGLLLVGRQLDLGAWFSSAWVIAALFGGFLIFMIADRHPAHCMIAFRHHHYLGLIIFIGIALDYQLG